MAKSNSGKRTTGLHRVLTGYFREHPNESVHIDDLHMVARERGIPEITDQSIQAALSYMRQLHKDGKDPINPEQLVKGVSWIYHVDGGSTPAEAKKSEKRMFEEIGVTKTGVVIAQDEQGNLYRVTEME